MTLWIFCGDVYVSLSYSSDSLLLSYSLVNMGGTTSPSTSFSGGATPGSSTGFSGGELLKFCRGVLQAQGLFQ